MATKKTTKHWKAGDRVEMGPKPYQDAGTVADVEAGGRVLVHWDPHLGPHGMLQSFATNWVKASELRKTTMKKPSGKWHGGGANMVGPNMPYYATMHSGGGALSHYAARGGAKAKNGRELLDAAIARIESKSIRAWATSEHNAPIWLKIAEGSFRKNGGGEDAILRLSTYMVLTAMG